MWNPGAWDSQIIPIARVSSVTPFVSCGNEISFKLNWKTVILTDVWYNFKKPFVWNISSSWDISLWTKLVYDITAIPTASWFSNYAIWLTTNNISYLWEDITLQNTQLLPYDWDWVRQFETRINSSSVAWEINDRPWIQVVMPVVSYTMANWQVVRYYLSKYENGNDRTPISLTGEEFIWIKIIWWLQWAWKYEFTGQWQNVSNLYPSDLRTEIRKRAYDYTKSMTSWQDPLNKVKYIEWDISISWDLPYETLVVKNWNVIITWNLNPSNSKLWIIVLKDWYDVGNWYLSKWNVLVNQAVGSVNAMIYADWWFISSDSSGIVYDTDSTDRTYSLQQQLTISFQLSIYNFQ